MLVRRDKIYDLSKFNSIDTRDQDTRIVLPNDEFILAGERLRMESVALAIQNHCDGLIYSEQDLRRAAGLIQANDWVSSPLTYLPTHWAHVVRAQVKFEIGEERRMAHAVRILRAYGEWHVSWGPVRHVYMSAASPCCRWPVSINRGKNCCCNCGQEFPGVLKAGGYDWALIHEASTEWFERILIEVFDLDPLASALEAAELHAQLESWLADSILP